MEQFNEITWNRVVVVIECLAKNGDPRAIAILPIVRGDPVKFRAGVDMLLVGVDMLLDVADSPTKQ